MSLLKFLRRNVRVHHLRTACIHQHFKSPVREGIKTQSMACFVCGSSSDSLALQQDKELDNYSTFGSGEIKGWLEKLSTGSFWSKPHYQFRYFLLRVIEHGRYELQYFGDEIARQRGEAPRLSIDLSLVSPEEFRVHDGKVSSVPSSTSHSLNSTLF